MVDNRTAESRSALMSRIRSKNTQPEIAVRSMLHRLGYRFRLHRKDLAGKPDIVLPKFGTAIFVHGCFWHGHDCKYGKRPKSKQDYWNPKIEQNKVRDRIKEEQLSHMGWNVMTIWQCELKDATALEMRLEKIVDNHKKTIDKPQKTG
ncbi:MAG: very short patch repair endonuclease [Sphingorhabdus sp.]